MSIILCAVDFTWGGRATSQGFCATIHAFQLEMKTQNLVIVGINSEQKLGIDYMVSIVSSLKWLK